MRGFLLAWLLPIKRGAFSTVLLAASPAPPSGGGDVACNDVVGAALVRLSGIRAVVIVVAPGASVGTCDSFSAGLGKDVFRFLFAQKIWLRMLFNVTI